MNHPPNHPPSDRLPVEALAETLRGHVRPDGPDSAPAVLVAASGGADSMALLGAALVLARAGEIRLYAAHLVHHPNSPEARSRASLVEDFCRRQDIPLETADLDPAELGQGSPEERMRRARYRFLENRAQKLACRWILTGHHAGDQAETVLLRVLLGTGLKGLSGIRAERGMYLRPFLSLRKADLEAWCRREGIPFAEDPANRDLSLPRNRLRHNVIPRLQEGINPRVEEALNRLAQWAGEARELIETQTDLCWGESLRIFQKTKIALDIDAILPYFKVIQKNTLARALESLAGDSELSLSAADQDRLAALLHDGRTGAFLEFPGGLRAVRHRRRIIFTRGSAAPVHYHLIPGRDRELPELAVRAVWQETPAPPWKSGQGSSADLALESPADPLILRRAREGDRFFPLGSPGEKRLFRFLTDRGVSREDKRATLVLERHGIILWVVGHRLSEFARVRDISEGNWRITLIPSHDSHLTESRI